MSKVRTFLLTYDLESIIPKNWQKKSDELGVKIEELSGGNHAGAVSTTVIFQSSVGIDHIDNIVRKCLGKEDSFILTEVCGCTSYLGLDQKVVSLLERSEAGDERKILKRNC
jgi:hypothetical protein